MVESFALPPLRQEIGLYPAPPGRDGAPSWSLHDPAANRFYLITWPAFEMLSRWRLGTPAAVAEAVNRETTLTVTEDDVATLVPFLQAHFLTDSSTPQDTARILEIRGRSRARWWLWLVKNYLFFRIPLFRPQRLLEKLDPWIQPLFTPTFVMVLVGLAGLSLLLLSRHWDEFIHSFTTYRTPGALLVLALTIPCAKVFHELGHACAARRFGCRVPSMGIAFLVMAPMLYTDTNEAWKLSSRRQRLIISSSGILAETVLAVCATLAWVFLPDGAPRAAAFFLATTAWTMTLAVNASPFMRFDGYFILSDILGTPNLHPRSFAFGTWWLRERLFGFEDPAPEQMSPAMRRFFIIFAFAVWLYRLVVFFGIALLVYHFFFKALGIILFAVEIVWFIALPIAREVKNWLKRRTDMKLNVATLRTGLLALVAVVLLLAPWQGSIRAPAMLGAVREQRIVSPQPGLVVFGPVPISSEVRKGEMLARITSPDIDAKIAQAAPTASVTYWQMTQQSFDEELQQQGMVLRKQWEGSAGVVGGLKEERDLLRLHAPFGGTVVYRNEDVMEGAWVGSREWLLSVADRSANRVDAYVEEKDLPRLSVGAKARFIPDASDYGAFSCRVAEIDRVNLSPLDDLSLASSHGGPIPTSSDQRHDAVPLSPRFRVRLDTCSPAIVPPLRLRGVAHLRAARQSPAVEMLRYLRAVLVRESGL